VLLVVVDSVLFFNEQKFDFLVYTKSNRCFHGVVALSIVSIYPNQTDHGQQHGYHHVPTENQRLLLQLIGS
jgi:hypothetical protein